MKYRLKPCIFISLLIISVYFIVAVIWNNEKFLLKQLENGVNEDVSEQLEIDKHPEENKHFDGSSETINVDIQVKLWIDVPDSFPWRHCIQEYDGFLTLFGCSQGQFRQDFTLLPIERSLAGNLTVGQLDSVIQWKYSRNGKCIVPGEKVHEDVLKETLVLSSDCSQGVWIWNQEGQLRWSQGCHKCVTSAKFNTPLGFSFCRDMAEDQNIEMGQYVQVGEEKKSVLQPIDSDGWRKRQNKLRTDILAHSKPEVEHALKDIEIDEMMYANTPSKGHRRAAVFYVDEGLGALVYIKWWLYTWHFIGLDSSQEKFDLVFFTHPKTVAHLPQECQEVSTDNFPLGNDDAGKCFFKPYIGISHRDKSYDPYMNSQECLFGPGSEFLSSYKVLLRADLDTFPTPHMLSYWPQPEGSVVVDKGYGTMMGKDNIMNALRELSCAAGIDHQNWFNFGSSWYGDGRRVRNLAKITVAMNKFGRAYMFGPGTPCRCAECTELPNTCQWGGGPYAGVMLLYLQEIAVNRILSKEEFESLPPGLLDQGVTDTKRSVCQPLLVHCMHNAELFSKFAFQMGKYSTLDMSQLDITNSPGYATFMALSSNDQGVNQESALNKWHVRAGNLSWVEYCKQNPDYKPMQDR